MALQNKLFTDRHGDCGTCFYFVGAEREERSRSGEGEEGGEERQRGRTCQWHSELETRTSLMAFCLSSPLHAGVAAPASPSCSAAPHTALCLGCELAQMLVSKSVDVSTGVSSLAWWLILRGSDKNSTDMTFCL